jgi:acyl dehydratase
MDEDQLEAVIGHRFPGGRFTIEPYEHWLMCDAVEAVPIRRGVANPMYVYFATLGGMGINLDELFALVGAAADDGVMFGEASITVQRPLQIGATYDVAGEVTGAMRKSGKRAGVFDIVTFELRLIDQTGVVAGVATNSFVFPRRQT